MITCYIVGILHIIYDKTWQRAQQASKTASLLSCFWNTRVHVDMFAFWGLTWSILQERLKSPRCVSVSSHCGHCVMDTFCVFSPLWKENAAEDPSLFVSKMRQRESTCEMWNDSVLPFLLWQYFHKNFMSIVMRSRTCLNWRLALESGKLCLKCSSSGTAQSQNADLSGTSCPCRS